MKDSFTGNASSSFSEFIRESMAIYHRDLKIELRSKSFLGEVILYPLILLAVIGVTIGGYDFGAANRRIVYSSMMWIILILAATPCMGHTFSRENSAGTMDLLRLSANARPLFMGKLFFNITVLFILESAVVPLYIVIMDVNIVQPPAYVLLLILGTIGFGSTTTLVAALASMDNSSGTIVSMISIPLLLPVLIVLVKGTFRYSMSASTSGWIEIELAAIYAFSMTAVSILLVPYFWCGGDFNP